MKIKKFRGEIDSHVKIWGLSDEIIGPFISANTIANPEYETLERFSAYGAEYSSIPDKLIFAWNSGSETFCHRGCLELLPSKYSNLRKFVSWKDKRIVKPAKFPELKITWNEEQQYSMQALEDVLLFNRRPFGNLLFLASTAVGKTILQSSIAARLGQQTLVLCPTELIMRAWYEDLTKAFGLTSSNIGLIKRSSFSIKSPITLASIQTLGRRRERWDEINASFGTIVVDEVQGCSAETMFSFLAQSPAKYLVGATATMENRKGPNHHLKALFGSPVVSVNTYHRETATSLPIKEVRLVKTAFKFDYQADNLDWHELSLAVTGDEARNALIVKNVLKDWSSGRSCLVTTKTREHASLLTEMLLEAGVTNTNEINGDTNTNKFYTNQVLKMVKDRKVTCIVATAQAIKTGANIPTLDSLHIAMPLANQRDWEQLIGRIRRKADGKESAVVTYYYDEKVNYMMSLFRRIVIPVFRKLKIPGYVNLYTA